MNVTRYEYKKDYFLSQGVTPKRLEAKRYRLLGKLNICDHVCQFITEPDRNRSVKTINSDPEFARWDGENLDF